jgi:hypothetical protein
MELSTHEQAAILSNPHALIILIEHHDLQQTQSDSMGAECWGNELRCEELRQHGAKIIAADPEAFDDEIRRRFAEPTGYALQRLTRAREAQAAAGVEGTSK